ncbi:hypothetical protein B7463_g1649, partial [Scytalidium lignicola]
MRLQIKEQYPWTTLPLITNAPMAGFAGAELALTVSAAGGIGFIGSANDMRLLEGCLKSATSSLENAKINKPANGTLPIGVGFLLFAAKLEEAVAVIAKYPPAVIWLSCPKETDDFAIWVRAIRSVSPSTSIWISIASIAKGIQVAEKCSPDALVMQGSDAGGHGPRPGAGIISLVPEMRDSLDKMNFQKMCIFATGGIADGRGVAAALASGADGVVLGTRFLASKEVELPAEEYRDVILRTNDGGFGTVRGTIFDEIKGKSIWPAAYDGRAVANTSYNDFLSGVSVEEIRERYNNAAMEPHKGFGGDVRAAIWAGTGVGLVNEIKGAAEIVKELRDGAFQSLTNALGRFTV